MNRSRRCGISPAAGWWLGGAAGLAAAGALLGAGIFLVVRGDHSKDRAIADFCRDYPFSFVGEMSACIDYWSRHDAPEQVCSRADPQMCVTFEKPSDNDIPGGVILIIISLCVAYFAARSSAALGSRLARARVQVGHRQVADDSQV